MEENMFVNVEYSPVKHAASRLSVRKNVTKKGRKGVTPGWTDISGPGLLSVFYPEVPLHYAEST